MRCNRHAVTAITVEITCGQHGVDPCVETGKMETVYGSLLMTVQQQG
jgi:hypothetical protein